MAVTTPPYLETSGPAATDLLAPAFVWGFWARWWDCVAERLDMCATTGTIPGLIQESWSYVDLYETEDTCITSTQQQAEAEFRARYPWIRHYHIRLLGEHKPPARKARHRQPTKRPNHD